MTQCKARTLTRAAIGRSLALERKKKEILRDNWRTLEDKMKQIDIYGDGNPKRLLKVQDKQNAILGEKMNRTSPIKEIGEQSKKNEYKLRYRSLISDRERSRARREPFRF
jgi:hypothetical protein